MQGSRVFLRLTINGIIWAISQGRGNWAFDLYGLDPYKVWIEFEGKSKIWIPKSITIRKLIMEPEYFPVTENLNAISFPIIKFYFGGVLSLTESYGIHKLQYGPYQVGNIVDPF